MYLITLINQYSEPHVVERVVEDIEGVVKLHRRVFNPKLLSLFVSPSPFTHFSSLTSDWSQVPRSPSECSNRESKLPLLLTPLFSLISLVSQFSGELMRGREERVFALIEQEPELLGTSGLVLPPRVLG